MSTIYPIRFADQLRQHLKGLRKKHGFTQAKLGQLLGVSQARIAEIEANPGLVNLDQLLQVFSALGVTLSLQELQTSTTVIDRPKLPKRIKSTNPNQIHTAFVWHSTSSSSDWKDLQRSYVTRHDVNVPTPNWHLQPIRNGTQQVTSVLVEPREGRGRSVADATSNENERSKLEQLRQLNPDKDVKPTSRRNFIIRPKKGSW